ncbi:inositol monophosphatase family protein [Micrococcus lylae]|uniref:inositol monophosphatase family protein n=1 Tax=Micrococcus lylae TaxID=1273 RepID=UPI000C7F9725|nr:inositol monophosphatase family protein [Micrococcus lylae]WIK82248.1 inositol monophosphatase family protein [Micrococcus lylae]
MARDLPSVPSPAVLRRVAVDAAAGCVPALRAAFRAGPCVPTTAAHPSLKTNHHDLVTEYDRATEAALVRALTDAVPGSQVLGEETGAHGDPHHPLRWIVDPIDGTSNFTHGFAMFSVSIAAEVDGELVAAAIADPAAGQVFSSDDTGAWLADLRLSSPITCAPPCPDSPEKASDAPEAGAVVVTEERPLAEVARPAPDAALGEHGLNLVTSYPAGEALALEGSAALERFGELVRTYATVRRTVSGALELAYTAAGWADAALYVDTKPWDVAAGVHLLRAAGGTWVGGDHTTPFALALAPGRSAPTALRVLDDIIRTRLTAGT